MPFVIQWVTADTGDQQITTINTPAGRLVLYSVSGAIQKTDWAPDNSTFQCHGNSDLQQLERYFLNPEDSFPIKLLNQGTPFRNRVWTELCEIPFGRTVSYSALAAKIGSAARAVGNACRDNPFPLLVPCHRVVSVSGLGGYNGEKKGDFMTIKRKLLDFEASRIA